MSQALDGHLVIDLSRLLPGPYCSMILADHGARVIAVESRKFKDESLPILSHINRNKQHMSLDLKTEKGRDIFYALAKKADIILESFRPGVVKRLGVGYRDIKKINPEIIYCSITGYGQTGPFKEKAGHDVNYMALGGALSIIGADSPVIPGIQMADMTGGLYAANAILMALVARNRTGRGQFIDISITDAVFSLLAIPAGIYWHYGIKPEIGASFLSHRYAFYNVYETADRKHIAIGALEPGFWKKLCDLFERPDYASLQYDEKRRHEIIDFFRSVFKTKTREEWIGILEPLDCCAEPVLEIDEALSSDLARDRGMVVEPVFDEKKETRMIGIVAKFEKTPGNIKNPPPGFGENTLEILNELGFSSDRIKELKSEGVI